MPPKIKHLCI